MDWKKFWQEYPATAGETEFLRQVGHTIGGEPYSAEVFEAMVESIRQGLRLGPDDVLLDLCCGNGVITVELARSCERVYAADFSETLIGLGRRHNCAPNITYGVLDVRELSSARLGGFAPFTRISMYAALQHLEPDDLEPLLAAMCGHAREHDIVILIGGILDATRQEAFLDTPKKREAYQFYRKQGADRLGTWWEPAAIRRAADKLGLACDIDADSPGRPGGHYRFDARLWR